MIDKLVYERNYEIFVVIQMKISKENRNYSRQDYKNVKIRKNFGNVSAYVAKLLRFLTWIGGQSSRLSKTIALRSVCSENVSVSHINW